MKVEPLDPAALASSLPPVTRAYLSASHELRSSFDLDWRDVRALAERARKRPPIEPAVADAIEAYLRRLGAPAESLASLKKLRAGAVCVVAGQQPGLLGGPLYNAGKAMTAIQLARRLEEAGLPAVPVFWNHSDDHDPADLGILALPEGGKVSVDLPDDGRPLSERRVDGAKAAADLEKLLPETPHRAAVAARLNTSSRDLLSDGFSAALLDWFGARGLIALEPSHLEGPRARALFDRVLADPSVVEAALERQTARLRQSGFEAAITGPLGSNLFEIRDGKRRRVEGKPGGGRLSAGVALRPVLQDSVLPVAAYVAGPNEIAYLAQLADLYRSLGAVMAPPVPRAGLTFIEPRIARFLEKLLLGPSEWLAGREAMLSRAASKRHGTLLDDVARLESDLGARLDTLGASLGEIDRSLVDLAKKTSGKAGQVLSAFRERVVETLKRSNQTDAGQIGKVADHLMPGGGLQERRLTPWYVMALAGPRVLDELLPKVDPSSGSHLVVRL